MDIKNKIVAGEFADFSSLVSLVSSFASDLPQQELLKFPPLFSFEGLPGAGKTTQIKRVALSGKLGKSCFFDIPTQSSIGLLLKHLYADKERWFKLSASLPWLNPLLVSVDLFHGMKQAVLENYDCVLMSRGILSTYYYNMPAFSKLCQNETEIWDYLGFFLKNFIAPKAVIFLDIAPEYAFERVVKRNRGTLRPMDRIENMRKDRERLYHYLYRLSPAPKVYIIDANQSLDAITEQICASLAPHLEI